MITKKHWQLHEHSVGYGELTFNKQGSATNTIDLEVLNELDAMLNIVATMSIKSLIIRSGKNNGFIFGADIKTFVGDGSHIQQVKELLERGHQVFNRLEKLPILTIAIINGFCLGGGLELALACDMRIAIETDKPCLGLPEVKLGIHPGWGGTIRAAKLIGSKKALELMLTGNMVTVKEALSFGLVDLVAPQRVIEQVIHKYCLEPKPTKKTRFLWRIIDSFFLRPIIGKGIAQKIKQRVNFAHYPAPSAMIDNWVHYFSHCDFTKAYKHEIDSMLKLLQTDTAKNLIRVFFLQEQLKGLGKVGKGEFKHVHVIGAGTMGCDIAVWCAMQGFKVSLQDLDIKIMAKASKRALVAFMQKAKSKLALEKMQDNLYFDRQGEGIKHADVVIEAIVENPKIKQAVFTDLEQKVRADTILATNTSTIPLDVISANMQNKHRLVGIHFFNPVAKMALVEVVSNKDTNVDCKTQALSFVSKIGKSPLPVNSSPGFLVNRVLFPYLIEAALLVEAGHTAEFIDKVACDFGMPMGPVELMDTIGLDICVAASTELHLTVPAIITNKIKEGKLGRKTTHGFYQYNKGKILRKSVVVEPQDEIKNRLLMSLIIPAYSCYTEGVVESQDLVDAGMIFGTGFAPFLGGPLAYLNKNSSELCGYAKQLEERFGKKFHLSFLT